MRKTGRSLRSFGYLISGLFLIGSILSASGGEAATFYVATNGSDSNHGTQSQPFRTIIRGVSGLKPGDTLFVRAGTYTEHIDANMPTGTSWNRPVTIAAYPGERVIWQAAPGSRAMTFCNYSGIQSYVIIQGFILEGTGGLDTVVKAYKPCHHLRFLRNEVRNSPGAGFQGDTDYTEFLYNHIHHNGNPTDGYQPGHPGLYWAGSFTLVEGNEVHNNQGTGLNIWQASNLSNAKPLTDITIRNNKVYNNRRPRNDGGYSGGGIFIGNFGMTPTRGLVYNNLIYNNDNGIQLGFGKTGVSDIKVYNNTVYNNGPIDGVAVYYAKSGIIVRNNIIYANTGNNLYVKGSAITLDHNLTTNPSFVDAAGRNFLLQPDSTAVNAGITIGVHLSQPHD